MSSKIYGAVLLAIITCFAAADALDDDGRLLSVMIVGTVFCDTCFKQHFSKNSYFISGTSVAVECRNNKQIPDFRAEAKTNDYGQFKVELVPSIFHSAKQLKRCSVTLLQNEEQKDPCKLISIANSSSFTLKSKQGNIHTYSAGSFSYRPQSPPPFCSQDVANDPKSGLKASLQSSQVSGLPPLLAPIFPSPTLSLPPLALVPPLPPLNVPPLPFPSLTSPSPLLPLPPNSFLSPPLLPLPISFQSPSLIPNPSQDLLPPIPLETPPLVPLPPLPPVEAPPLVPLPPLPPVEAPPLVPLPPLPPVGVPPLVPPAQSSLRHSFQSPPLIPNPFEAPSKDLLPPIPLETPPLVPLPPLPPVEAPPLVPLPPLPPVEAPPLVPLPPLPPVEAPPLVPLPPLPPVEAPPLVPLPPLPPVGVPPLVPPAQSSLRHSFQSPPLIPNPFEAPSKDLLPPIPLETPPLVPLPPLPPVKVPTLVPLPPLPPVVATPLVPLPPLPPLIPPVQFSPQIHD